MTSNFSKVKNFLKTGPQWSGFFLSGTLAWSLTLTSCQPPQSSPAAMPDRPAQSAPNPSDPSRSYLGLTKNQATAKAETVGLQSRVVREGSKRFPITKELRAGRINFEVDNGVVTTAKMY